MSALQNNDDLSKIHLLGSVPLVSHWSKIALSLASRNANNDETEDLALIWDFDTLSSGRATCPTLVYTQKTDTTLEQQTTSLFPRIASNAEARFWRWSWLCANCHGFPVMKIQSSTASHLTSKRICCEFSTTRSLQNRQLITYTCIINHIHRCVPMGWPKQSNNAGLRFQCLPGCEPVESQSLFSNVNESTLYSGATLWLSTRKEAKKCKTIYVRIIPILNRSEYMYMYNIYIHVWYIFWRSRKLDFIGLNLGEHHAISTSKSSPSWARSRSPCRRLWQIAFHFQIFECDEASNDIKHV